MTLKQTQQYVTQNGMFNPFFHAVDTTYVNSDGSAVPGTVKALFSIDSTNSVFGLSGGDDESTGTVAVQKSEVSDTAFGCRILNSESGITYLVKGIASENHTQYTLNITSNLRRTAADHTMEL